MLTGLYVPYENIVDRLFRLGIAPQFIDDNDCQELIYDAIRKIAAPSIFIERTTEIVIADGFGDLPCDFYSMDDGGVRHLPSGVTLVYSPDIYHFSTHNIINTNQTVDTSEIESALMHTAAYLGTPTYKLQSGCIHTGFSDGIVEMSYKAFPTDERGAPLIPDDIRIILYVTYSVAESLAMGLWIKDQLAEAKYREISKECAWYIGSAQNSARLINADKMQILSNTWTNPVRDSGHHMAGFKRLANRPRFKTHN